MNEAALDLYDSLDGEVFLEFEHVDLDMIDRDEGVLD